MSDIANPPRLPSKPTTPMSRALGGLLRRVRRNAEMSMGDMARVIGVSVVRISELEHGEAEPTAFEVDRYRGAIEPLDMRGEL